MNEHEQQPNEQPAGSVPPAAPAEASAGEITTDEKNMAMLCHLLGIFTGFIGPLIIWLVKKEDSKYVDQQGKEALNFQITLFIVYFVSLPLMYVCIGLFTFLAAFVCAIVFGIMACLAAKDGQPYRYPLAIRLVS